MGFLDRLFRRTKPKPPPPPKPSPEPPPGPIQDSLKELRVKLLAAHNTHRFGKALPLQSNELLHAAAQGHADWMASRMTLSHTGSGGSGFAERIADEGYRLWTGGENIAAGYATVEGVMTGWINSRGHRRNILGAAFTEVGFGYRSGYWCVVFASPAEGKSTFVMLSEQPEGIVGTEF